MASPRRFRRLTAGVLCLGLSTVAFAGFASTETFLPAVGRLAGQGGAQFYTTVWATNLTGAPVSFTFGFLKQGQANTAPANFTDTLTAGQTKVYENVVETKLGLANALGAARITSTGEILVAERIFNQAPGADLGDTEGLFFAGVPKSFSISAGQSASIQGINQGGSENFRYNFALVETGGGSPTVNVQVFDGDGTLLGQKAYPLQPYEQRQPGVAEIVAGIHTTNARITATVTGGTGSVLLAGAQLANISQDSSGFEMSFRDDLLGGGGGTAGVTSLNSLTGAVSLIAGTNVTLSTVGNGLKIDLTGGAGGGVPSVNGITGAVTIAHGANTTVNVVGSTITIDAVAGSGTGLTAVAHDNSLAGSGTVALPLGIANGQVVRSLTANGTTLHDAVTLAPGPNITLTPSGNTITIASTGGGGGLTLPYTGSAGTPGGPVFSIANTSTGSGIQANAINTAAIYGFSTYSRGVFGDGGAYGVFGQSGNIGVHGQGNIGVKGIGSANGDGVYGTGFSGVHGVGVGSFGYGVYGEGDLRGVYGQGEVGVYGFSTDGLTGVYGEGQNTGVAGRSIGGSGVYGHDVSDGFGVFGETDNATAYAVYGFSHYKGYAGYFDGNLHVAGTLSKSGGSFKIDHPLDPAHQYLSHSFVESPDMMNIYDGMATLDASGAAAVTLPEWFEALNRDFRYQLTAIGTPQPGLYVSRKVNGNEFRIAGGVPGAEVSWMVTGIRHDAWADAHRIPVDQWKPDAEQGTYLDPAVYGQPEEKSVRAARERAGKSSGATPTDR